MCDAYRAYSWAQLHLHRWIPGGGGGFSLFACFRQKME